MADAEHNTHVVPCDDGSCLIVTTKTFVEHKSPEWVKWARGDDRPRYCCGDDDSARCDGVRCLVDRAFADHEAENL